MVTTVVTTEAEAVVTEEPTVDTPLAAVVNTQTPRVVTTENAVVTDRAVVTTEEPKTTTQNIFLENETEVQQSFEANTESQTH